MADRVAVLNAGRLEQCAPPAELYERPATPFVAEFVGTMNRVPGRLTGDGSVEVAAAVLPVDGDVPAGRGRVDVLIRPENIGVSADADGTATVVSAAFLGSVTRVLLDLPDGVAVKADLPSRDATELAPGVRARVVPVRRPVLVVPVRETTAPDAAHAADRTDA